MKCSDIPDDIMLACLAMAHNTMPMNIGVNRWVLHDTIHAFFGVDLPERLFMAKMRKLIRKGLVSGCVCGCRGDFFIVKHVEDPAGT